MSDFEDLSTFLDDASLRLPIDGTVYEVAPCTGETWLRLQSAIAKAEGKPTEGEAPAPSNDMELFRMSLGEDVFKAMLAAATPAKVAVAGTTAWLWQTGQSAAAELFWRSGGKVPEPVESTGTSTDEAPSTSQPASSNGTSTPKKSSARSRPKKTA